MTAHSRKGTVFIIWVFLTMGLGGFTVWGEAQESSQEAIRALIQEGSYELALRRLCEDQAPADSLSPRFQKAYCLQKLGRWHEAALLYEELLETPFLLEEYVRHFLAICYVRSGQGQQAEEQLKRLLEEADYLLANEARELLAQVYLQWGRAEEAIQTYELLSQSPELKDRLPEFRFSMGQAHRQAGRGTEAANLFAGILSQHPASGVALEAVEELKAIRQTPLADGELFAAAGVLFHQGRYGEAAEGWSRFVKLYPHHRRAPEALFLSAQASYRGNRYSQAVAKCRQLLQGYAHSQQVTSAHYLMARCAEAEGKTTLAAARYHKFVREYPWSQLADDALWRVARLHERMGDFSAAQREYLTLSRQYASRQRAAEALWRAGLWAFFLRDDVSAIALFSRLETRYPQSPWAVGSLYWRALAHLRSGGAIVAEQLLGQVLRRDSGGYYGMRARGRLGETDSCAVRGSIPWEALSVEAPGEEPHLDQTLDRHYQRGQVLIRLGLLTLARRELSKMHRAAHRYLQVAVELLQFYQQFQLYGDALRLAQQMDKHLDQSPWRQGLEPFLYPQGYRETVAAEAGKYGLNSHFLWAVMRVESLFDPLVVSPAGAMGLMQIMSSTRKEIEERLGLADNPVNSPFRPELNIRLGSYYLWRQLEDFGGRPEMALAAYNAGPSNVRRWLRWLGTVDPELFVELIEFAETRGFVKRVLATQAHYERIWSAQE